MFSAPSLPRHNSSTDLPSELLSTTLVWVHRGGVVPPLQPLHDGPYAVRRGPRAFTASIDAVPVPSASAAHEVGPVTSSPPSRGQSSGGALPMLQ
jgi:hypothetical protein